MVLSLSVSAVKCKFRFNVLKSVTIDYVSEFWVKDQEGIIYISEIVNDSVFV